MGRPGSLRGAIALSILSLVITATYALPAPAPAPATKSTASPRATPPKPNAGKCATNADNDLYGTGVRVGLYLQWASGFILRNLESWETRSRVRTITNTLCAAVALATVVKILRGNAMSVDYLLSYYLTVVLFYTESYNLEIRVDDMHARNPKGRSSVKTLELHADPPLVCQNVIFTAFTFFGAWYWLKGEGWTSDPACGAQAALLGIFDIRESTWRHAAAGLAVIAGVAFFMVFLIHLTSLYDGIKSGPKLVAMYYARAAYSGCGDVSNNDWKYTLMLKRLLKPDLLDVEMSGRVVVIKVFGHFVHYFLIFLAGPLIAIVSVERMIAANYLVTTSALGSAGQVIALFSGITSALLACWEVAAKRMKAGQQQADAAEEPSQGSASPKQGAAPRPGQSGRHGPAKANARKSPAKKRKPRIWFSQTLPDYSQGRLMRWFRMLLLPFRPNKELYRAVKWKDAKAVRRMLRLGIKPDKPIFNAPRTSTVMHEAASMGRLEIVSMFLDHGCAVDIRDSRQGTPLSYAAFAGHIAIVNLLLEKGADVHARDRMGWTPIYRAAFKGSEAIIDVLLAKGADINVKNNVGGVPLEVACACHHEKTVRHLLERGAHPGLVEIKSRRGESWQYRQCLDIIAKWKPKSAVGNGLSDGVDSASDKPKNKKEESEKKLNGKADSPGT